MASAHDLRHRIRSIGNTAQITNAMQMVAASKMRKAQQLAIEVRPFVQMLYRIQRIATTRPIEFVDPLFAVREVRKRAVILVASDKGLCGALNSNLSARIASYELAYRMQSSAEQAVDLNEETEETKNLYGYNMPNTQDFARKCILDALIARIALVEP